MLAALLASPAAAQDLPAAISRCRAITDQASRLQCFDAASATAQRPASPAAGQGDFVAMDFNDLKLDIGHMMKSRVEVKGYLMQMGDQAMLSGERMSMSPMMIDVSHLDRDSRKRILENCGMQCSVTVRGVVEHLVFGPGLQAIELTVD